MQAHGFAHLRPEPLGQPVGAGVAVPVVGAAHQVAPGDDALEVSDVVEQRGRDQRGRRAGGLGQHAGLQHVLGLADRLAQVLASALVREQFGDGIHSCAHGCDATQTSGQG